MVAVYDADIRVTNVWRADDQIRTSVSTQLIVSLKKF